jgi:hypothetical protein
LSQSGPDTVADGDVKTLTKVIGEAKDDAKDDSGETEGSRARSSDADADGTADVECKRSSGSGSDQDDFYCLFTRKPTIPGSDEGSDATSSPLIRAVSPGEPVNIDTPVLTPLNSR